MQSTHSHVQLLSSNKVKSRADYQMWQKVRGKTLGSSRESESQGLSSHHAAANADRRHRFIEEPVDLFLFYFPSAEHSSTPAIARWEMETGEFPAVGSAVAETVKDPDSTWPQATNSSRKLSSDLSMYTMAHAHARTQARTHTRTRRHTHPKLINAFDSDHVL